MSVIEKKIEEDILIATLNRPDKLNALNRELLEELHNIIEEVKNNKDIKGLILIGTGVKAFCAGADIQKLALCDVNSGYDFAQYGQFVFRELEEMGKPSIAAINGYAFGGGCELAMSATLRIASKNAQLGQPEIKLGVIPGYGGTQRLPRLIGKGRALDLCLTGRFIDAQTACDWGLVSKVVEQEELLPTAINTLTHIIKFSPLAIESIMQTIDKGYNLSLDDALHLEAIHFAKACATKDKQEGVNAFLEKREPRFIGE